MINSPQLFYTFRGGSFSCENIFSQAQMSLKRVAARLEKMKIVLRKRYGSSKKK